MLGCADDGCTYGCESGWVEGLSDGAMDADWMVAQMVTMIAGVIVVWIGSSIIRDNHISDSGQATLHDHLLSLGGNMSVEPAMHRRDESINELLTRPSPSTTRDRFILP